METLAHGTKAVVGNTGYKRFLQVQRGSMRLDTAAIEADARLDGKFVLRTNTELTPEEVARAYKGLWRVERTFREEKSTLEVRPIFHHRDDTSVGHIVACFLALRLEVDGHRYQDGSTRTMIFGVAHLVHYVSQFMSLQPGDIISTGTPPGVGMGIKPEPVWLKPGQTMRLGIEGLGEQQQQTVAYSA